MHICERRDRQFPTKDALVELHGLPGIVPKAEIWVEFAGHLFLLLLIYTNKNTTPQYSTFFQSHKHSHRGSRGFLHLGGKPAQTKMTLTFVRITFLDLNRQKSIA